MVAALYRRYRPESFSEMIGQSQVTEPLMTALRNGRVGHAYLFSGPRGCGKTTSARILARCLNCAEGPTDNPCGVCPSCIELSRDGGGSLDVVEIDAASHGGVDDARDLRERAVFAPARDRFKIFIIDEAHMVTSAGFNALLKIVEEPPPHVKFVFATTEPEKVIGTIRSRTHHYPFRLIAPGTLIDYVQTLCDSEGVQIEPGVLSLVVRAGGGSARDTLSILDQLIAGSEGNLVTADRAAGLLGFTGSELLDDVVTAFGAHDAAAAFYATDRVVQTGQDPRRFVEDLLERLRDLIVVTATTVEGAAAVFRGVPQDQLTRMFEQAQRFGSGELSRIADVTSDTLNRMVGATAPRLQLELMIARALVGLDELRAAAAAPAGMPRGGAQQGQQQAQSEQGQQAPQAQQPNQMQQAQMQQRQGQGSAQPAPAQHPGQFVAPGQQRVQPQAQAPAQPQAPAQDPISALAAARGAVTQQSAPQTGAPQQPEPQTGAPQGAPTPLAASQGTAAPASPETAPGAPNAAQTAASVRDFLREDTSGAQQGMPVGQPQQAQVAPAQTAPEQPAQQQPVPAQPATPAQSAPAQAAQAPHDPSKPHPNEGAAGFGRSISAVLSAAQIASIGAEPTKPLKPATPAAQPNPAQQPAQAQGVPGQPGATAQPGTAQASSAQPAEQAPGQPASQPHEPQGVPAAGPVDGQPVDGVDAEIADDAEGGLSDLLEVWPDLLEEILEQDRAAWNAVKSVQPLSLEGDVLAVGIASRSDLEAFKASGAGPLREAILSAVGITVRYVPRPIPQGGAPAAPADEPAEPAAEEPHRAPPAGAPASVTQASASTAPPSGPPAAAQVNDNDPVARAAARLSALGPALAAPAWADPVPEAPATVAAPAAQAPAAQTPVPEATVPQPTAPEATASQATASQAITSQDSAPTLAQKSEPAQAEAPELAPAGAAPGQEPASDVSTGGGAPAAEPTSARAAGSSEQPQKAANQSAQPAMDDPYANDPYAGEPSDDSYDDPYASGQGGGFTPAAPPAQSTPAAQVAPAQQVADPEPQRASQPAAASQAPAPAPTPQAPTSAQPAPAPAQQAPAPQAPGHASAPTFTRYGESVVRETLGARFLEELPLAPPAPLD